MLTKVSIIVPVYNCEKFLPACIESIAAQTCPDFECILVDDGSSDGSGAVCDGISRRDPRFRTIHKPNGGVCSARNAGLDAARGEFVLFCDQDDRIHPETIATALAHHERAPEDLVMWLYTRDPGEFSAPLPEGETLFSQKQFGTLYCTFMLPPVWNKLFERNVLEGPAPLRFDTSVHNGHEDLPFVYDYLARLAKLRPGFAVHLLRAPLYYWSDENDMSVSKKDVHYERYFEVELDLFTRFSRDCTALYHCTPQDMAAFYQHALHTLAYGLLFESGVRGRKLLHMPGVAELLDGLKAGRSFSPFYLPFRWHSPALARFLIRAEQEGRRSYERAYWLFYYLLGGNWCR
ncbi:glycosyltransferase family 2 protein [Candidatus Allofournierella merdipullorum]|uniref:glycosyltransferase family 2 protein n=1 Tax=Candidatus Allofournierella merdipullorum TaxID=2838595 RepID=UPI003AB4638B